MSGKITDDLKSVLDALDKAGIPRRGRNPIVAEKTGYSTGMIAKLLSGHAAITDRFKQAVFEKFGSTSLQDEQTIYLNGWYTRENIIKILYDITFPQQEKK